MPTILLVDDDNAHRGMLRMMLTSWGYTAEEAVDGLDAVEKVRERHAANETNGKAEYDCLLMDIRMARMDGITALTHILAVTPDVPILIMTAFSSVSTAIEALKRGAYDYLTKPLDFDTLRLTLERALEHQRLKAENTSLKSRLNSQEDAVMVGRSKPMQRVKELIDAVAASEATVLITGESGTGKELVAKALHSKSLRKEKPMVLVNCAALNDNLLESELFGHERGAFTGADKRRDGRFVQADGGTLFLDELGEMSTALQAKLLRALQEGEVQRVGSDRLLHVNVRVIAATNRDLAKEVERGNFREDLFYRLNVVAVTVPPLRERQEDIPLLAGHFLSRYAAQNRKNLKGFSPQVMQLLSAYPWPGNIRELENVVERAVIMCVGDYITERELPQSVYEEAQSVVRSGVDYAGAGGTAGVSSETAAALGAGLELGGAESPANAGQNGVGYASAGQSNAENGFSAPTNAYAGLSLEDLEKRAIEATLQECGDNKSEAARRLGITRATLHSKLKKYGLGEG